MSLDLPCRETMCSTCPFAPNSPTAHVREAITHSALTEAARICHQTGSNNLFHRRTGLPRHICRGARDLQLQMLAALGFLEEATDEAWNARRVEMGMPPLVIEDPRKAPKPHQDKSRAS
jgi:hypothetical protein